MLHLREAWATVPLDQKDKTPVRGMAPAKHRRKHHDHHGQPTEGNPTGVCQTQARPVTLDGNRAMTVKQAIFTLAPTLERMRKRGFDTQEIVEKLHEKGIEVKPQTLTQYLTEARRQREERQKK